MALLFPRLARNFVKDGYFPTDSETLIRIAGAIDPDSDIGTARIIDPCCGEGAALNELENHLKLNGRDFTSFGIEINEERAYHAKEILQHVAHSNIEQVWVSQKSCGFLFLNPPYGDMIRDKGDIDNGAGLGRLEAHFLEKSQDWLQPNGLMVLIVPHYIVDERFARMVTSHFTDVSIFLAPEQQFKQCVIFGVKRRQKAQPTKRDIEALVTSGKQLVELPETWMLKRYTIPSINSERADKFTFKIVEIEVNQLKAELSSHLTLWPQMKAHFAIRGQSSIRPLMPMSPWHLALALVSGQVNGYVEGSDGQRYLVKGSTHKTKKKTVGTSASGGNETVMTDRFEPRIIGFNLTAGELFGSIVHIVSKIESDDDNQVGSIEMTSDEALVDANAVCEEV